MNEDAIHTCHPIPSMPAFTPQLLLEDGTVIDCRDGGVIGRQGDVGDGILSREVVLSRRHLLLQTFDGTWFLTLLPEARNRTWLDGEEMREGVSRALHWEHDLQVGERHFGIRLAAANGAGAAVPQFPWSVTGDGFDALAADLPAYSGELFSGASDHAAAIECLRQLPGHALLLDDDLIVRWLSVETAAALGDEHGVGSEFLDLFGVTEIPEVRRNLERLRGEGGSSILHPAGLAEPLRFLYRFPYYLGAPASGGEAASAPARARAAALLGALAGHAIDPAFQTGDVARAITLATAAACRELSCLRVAAWFADESDPSTIVCRNIQTATGGGTPGASVRMNHCPAFFDDLRRDSAVVVTGGDSPVLSILREIGFLGPATCGAMAAPIRQGDDFLGLIVCERAEASTPWNETEHHFAACAASLCLLAMQTLRSQERLAELREKEGQLAAGLAEARRYVTRLLPEPMHHADVSTEWYFEPSEELGGDAFGYHWLDENRLAMYVLDVVGHGTGAALLAVSVINTMRNRLAPDRDFGDPAAVLSEVNRSFQMEDQGMMTFTAWYGVFDRVKRTILYSSAGHPPALLVWPHYTGEGLDFRELGTEGLIIGGMEDAVYTNEVIEMGPARAKLYLYSDGAFEIPLGPERFWSFEEFIAAVRATRTMESGEPEYLYQRARALCVADALPDDFSMVRFLFPAADNPEVAR